MTVAVLIPGSTSSFSNDSRSAKEGFDRDILQRMATIVRRYATDRVAIRDGAVEVDLADSHQPPAAIAEQVRRIAVLTKAWVGPVRHELRESAAPEQRAPGTPATTRPAAVRLAAREHETPSATLNRVEKALRRLAAMNEAANVPIAGFVLQLERGDRSTAMPLPLSVLQAPSLERWLPPSALQGVTGLRLETRVRRESVRPVRSPRNPVRPVSAAPLSRVS